MIPVSLIDDRYFFYVNFSYSFTYMLSQKLNNILIFGVIMIINILKDQF